MGFRDGAELERLPRSLRLFLGFEQEHLWRPERLRCAPDAESLDARYLPEGRAVFELPCFWVERRYLYVYGNELQQGWAPKFPKDWWSPNRILFPVHPAELGRYKSFLSTVHARDAAADGVDLIATPTSSIRTLLVWPDGHPERAFFAKLSMLSKVQGDRRLGRRSVASSIGMAQLAAGLPAFASQVRYFPETLGLVPRHMPGGGAIIREIPEEIISGIIVPAPLFALIGGRREPLLLSLVNSGRIRFLEFFEEVLCVEFARRWIDLVFMHGLILEAHGQDLMLALSPNLDPLPILYYRDFEGLAVDWQLRKSRGLHEPPCLPLVSEWYQTYATWGYPLYQMVSWKLRTSLFDYLRLVLGELEAAILEWQAHGILLGEKIRENDLTSIFSRHLRSVIRQRFGLEEPEEYNVSQQLSRFVVFLMRLRKDVLSGGLAHEGVSIPQVTGARRVRSDTE